MIANKWLTKLHIKKGMVVNHTPRQKGLLFEQGTVVYGYEKTARHSIWRIVSW